MREAQPEPAFVSRHTRLRSIGGGGFFVSVGFFGGGLSFSFLIPFLVEPGELRFSRRAARASIETGDL